MRSARLKGLCTRVCRARKGVESFLPQVAFVAVLFAASLFIYRSLTVKPFEVDFPLRLQMCLLM